MPRLSLPVVIVCALHLIYITVITTLWLVGGPTPPPAIGSVMAASIVSAVVLATRRPDSRAEVEALARVTAALAARLGEVEERLSAPQRVYIVPTPTGSAVGVNHHEGLGPEAIEALRRMDRRLDGKE